MNHVKYFKDLFESLPEYGKIVFLMFLFENHVDLLNECGFMKNNISRLCKEFINILLEQNEEELEYFKKKEESVLEMVLNKKMKAYFSTMFEDVRHERSLILLLSVTGRDIIKQSKYTDHEIKILKKLALEKLHR